MSVNLENLELDQTILEKVKVIPKISTDGVGAGVGSVFGNLLSYLTEVSNSNILEIGCGQSSGFIYPHIKSNDFYIIDTNKEKLDYVYSRFIQELPDKISQVKFVLNDSRRIDLGDIKLDFLWIDGDHSLSAFINDFARFLPSLNIGGYVLAHDFNYGYPNGVSLFGEFIIKNQKAFGVRCFNRVKNYTKEDIIIGDSSLGLFLCSKVSHQFIASPNRGRYGL